MKRGYMERNAAFVPDSLLEERRSALISAFDEYGVTAAVIFGDVADADELHFFSNLGPYWGSATCILDRSGKPVLVTGMTARVNFWVSMMSGIVRDQVHSAGPKVNSAVAAYLQEHYPQGGKIGVIGEYFPAEMRQKIEASGFSTVWMQDVAQQMLQVRDQGYRQTLQKGAELLCAAYEKAFRHSLAAEGHTMQRVAADVEYSCRSAGAMDCYLLAGDERFVFAKAEDVCAEKPWTLYALLQYLGEWIAISRNTDPERNRKAYAVRNAFLRQLRPGNVERKQMADGWEIELCDEMRSDHAAFRPEGTANLAPEQIIGVRVRMPQEGILIEDMAVVGAQGARVLTAFEEN